MKKTYQKPVVVSKQIHTASKSACGLTSYGGCGKLVQKNV